MSQDILMRYPEGRDRALTLSYDDGVEQDIRLISIMNKNGLKGTFNLNSGIYAREEKVYSEGDIHRRMSRSRITETYLGSGHEVAVHTYRHKHLEQLSAEMVAYETIKDRETLEEQFGTVIRGFAYPFGSFNDTVVEVLKACGIAYARTTIETGKFLLPKDWLRLEATCHHKNPKLMEYADKFIRQKVNGAPIMFYLWGHSYEFDADNNWNVIEEFAEFMGGRKEIWYATNIEIYDYVQDYKRLIFSAAGNRVYNPSCRSLWFAVDKKIYEIKPGETLEL